MTHPFFNSIFLFCLGFFQLQAAITLPDKFLFKPDSLRDVTAYHLEIQGEKPFGKVERAKKNKEIYYYFKIFENTLAHAYFKNQKIFSEILVFSENQEFIGSIRHIQYFLTPARYEIYDFDAQLIAFGDMNWVGSRFTVKAVDNRHKKLASFNRPYFRLPGDYWYLTIHDSEKIDPRIFVILGTFQCDVERKDSPIRGDS